MKKGRLLIKETQQEIVSRCLYTQNSWERMVGLLNHSSLAREEGMIFSPCTHIHTLFMRFAIDVVFLDREDRVVATYSLKPWRMTPLVLRARKAIELPYGRARELDLRPGLQLEWRSDA